MRSSDAGERFGSPIIVIADESHRDFADDTEYRQPSTFIDRTVIVYSFGKYHFLQGQRIGYVAVSPRYPDREQVAQELVRWTRILGLATPTALMQKTVPRLLDLHHDLDWVTAWRARYVAELTTFGYQVVTPDATLFIYVRTPQGSDDFGFIEQLASASVPRAAGAGLPPSRVFPPVAHGVRGHVGACASDPAGGRGGA